MDWSVVTGLAIGLGVPGMSFTLWSMRFIVRLESRTSVLETYHLEDRAWRKDTSDKLDRITREQHETRLMFERILGSRAVLDAWPSPPGESR